MQDDQRPPVSALLATMGRPQLLEGCLEAFAGTLQSGDELIVAEAGGDTAPALMEAVLPSGVIGRHLRVEPPGKCRQLNVALRHATHDVVLLTDDDVRFPPSWSTDMVQPFHDPAVGLACGPVRGLSGIPGAKVETGPPAGEAPLETWRFAHGAAMAVRRRAAFEAGGFDERLGPGSPAAGEDHDFVLRVRELGWRVVVAAAEPAQHVGWRQADEDRDNALSYERGGGAVVGAALRRSRAGAEVLKRRLAYQAAVLMQHPGYGARAMAAFAAGLAYGLRLDQHAWLDAPAEPYGSAVTTCEGGTVGGGEDDGH